LQSHKQFIYFRIKKNEYDEIVKPLIRSYVQTSLNSFVNDKMTEIFELFLFNNTKLSQKNIFELVFKISTSYIKTVYNIESNQKEELTSGEKLILYNLFEIHQTFTVGLFTNNSSEIVEAYSNCYTVISLFYELFLILIINCYLFKKRNSCD
jgi:hypothetical protein